MNVLGALLLTWVLQDAQVEPSSVEVGEPCTVELELSDPARLSDKEREALPLDLSWIVLDASEELIGSGPRRRVRLELASTRPGERVLPLRELLASIGIMAPEALPGPVRVSVAGVLAPAEDEPRPLRDFPEGFGLPQAPSAPPIPSWAFGLLSIVLFAGAWILWRRGRGNASAPAPVLRPTEALTRLRALATDDAEGERERHYDLSRLLREATDASLGRERAGLTDDEWLAELARDGRLGVNEQAELEQVLGRCAAVKYAGERPSSWTTDEVFSRAEKLVLLAEAANRRSA